MKAVRKPGPRLATAFLIALLPTAAPAVQEKPGDITLVTYDGRHDVGRIHLTAVYYVPKGRTPLPDWKDRVTYFMKRVDAFHRREFGGRSRLIIDVHPAPLASPRTPDELRGGGDQNVVFHSTMKDVRALLKWTAPQTKGFPVLLVMSDINWRELDDFHRTRIVDGRPEHEGHVARDGRHFPGAKSGGARALYLPNRTQGWALISADGWRVPYSGSDCVVYHEGVGHVIGLPHPEPADGSVMSLAQYRYWINQTWVNPAQKRRLGWKKPGKPDAPASLFTAFTALPDPPVPAPNEPVFLHLTWPADAEVKSVRIRVQTDLFGPWRDVPVKPEGDAPARLKLDSFDRPTPVSYRVDATLKDSRSVELWGYFQVRKKDR